MTCAPRDFLACLPLGGGERDDGVLSLPSTPATGRQSQRRVCQGGPFSHIREAVVNKAKEMGKCHQTSKKLVAAAALTLPPTALERSAACLLGCNGREKKQRTKIHRSSSSSSRDEPGQLFNRLK